MNLTKLHKITGYILLAVGLLLIIMPLFQAYNIFTGKELPAQVFKQEKVEVTGPNNPFDIQQQVQKGISNMLPIDLINNTLNLSSWMILMLILIFGGGKIANIGIQLIKIDLLSDNI